MRSKISKRARESRATKSSKVTVTRKADKRPARTLPRQANSARGATGGAQFGRRSKPIAKTTALRQRMGEDLKLAGYAQGTQECYLRAVRQLADHYGQSPDTLCDQHIRDYFLFLKQTKHFAACLCLALDAPGHSIGRAHLTVPTASDQADFHPDRPLPPMRRSDATRRLLLIRQTATVMIYLDRRICWRLAKSTTVIDSA